MHISQEPEDLETQTKKQIIPDVSVVDIHWYNGASGHICHVIEVNMHQMPIFYHICYKPAKRALLTSYFKQMSINHLQNSFSYILRWYLKYINIQIDYTSGLKNRGIWPQCPTKGVEFAAFDVQIIKGSFTNTYLDILPYTQVFLSIDIYFCMCCLEVSGVGYELISS